jgi:hypothetical protein
MEIDENTREYNTEFMQYKAKYKDSNFYQTYKEMADGALSAPIKSNQIHNPYHSETFSNALLEKYISNLPLSNSSVLNQRDELGISSNATVEGYHSQNKQWFRKMSIQHGKILIYTIIYSSV